MEISKEKKKAVKLILLYTIWSSIMTTRNLCCRDINDNIHGNINIVCSKRVQILAHKSNINNPDAFLDCSGISGVTKFHKNLRTICMHWKTKKENKDAFRPLNNCKRRSVSLRWEWRRDVDLFLVSFLAEFCK